MNIIALAAAAFFAVSVTAAAQTCPPPARNTTSARLEAAERCIALQAAKNAEQDRAIANAGGAPTARLDAVEAKADQSLATARETGKAVAAIGDRLEREAARNDEQDDVIARILKDLALGGSGEPPANDTDAVARPNRNGGRPISQFGPTFGGFAWPVFIDARRESGPPSCGKAAGGTTTDAEIISANVLDPQTLDLTTLGPFTHCDIGLFRFLTRYYPDQFAGTWVVDWQNASADVQVLRCGGARSTAARRIEITFAASDRTECLVRVSSMATPGALGLRIYRAADEAALNAGRVFRDDFVAYAKRYGIIRDMDFKAVNIAPARLVEQGKTTDAVWLQTPTDPVWATSGLPISGVSNRFSVKMAREADTTLWVHASPYLGAPQAFETAFALPLQGWEQRALQTRAIGQASFAEVMASGAQRAWADDLVAALVAENYAKTDTVYVELGNEIWNTGGLFYVATNWVWGLGAAIDPSYGPRQGYGYASAKLADALTEALAAAGRSDQRVVFVLAGQSDAWPGTKAALETFKKYFTDRGRDPAPYVTKVGVTVANYVYAFNDGGRNPWGAQTWAELRAAMEAAAADPDGFALAIGNYLTNDASPYGVKYLWDKYAEHCDIAQQFGAQCITPYEGIAHSTSPWFQSNAALRAAGSRYELGPQGARVERALIEHCVARFPADEYPELGCMVDFVGMSAGNCDNDSQTDGCWTQPWEEAPPHRRSPRDLVRDEYSRVLQ